MFVVPTARPESSWGRELVILVTELWVSRWSRTGPAKGRANSLFTEQMDNHAYGFILSGQGETLSIRHFGGNEGYRSMMILYPETGDGAVFLANSDAGHEIIGMVVRAVSDAYEWQDFQPVTVTRAHPDEAALKQLAGKFRFESGIEVRVDYDAERNAVTIEFPNGDVYVLAPTDPEAFIHPETAVTVGFDGRDRLTVYGDTGIRVDESE